MVCLIQTPDCDRVLGSEMAEKKFRCKGSQKGSYDCDTQQLNLNEPFFQDIGLFKPFGSRHCFNVNLL